MTPLPVPEALVGCAKEELDTPALLVDLDALESNVEYLAAYCRDHHTAWRPHSKAHKCPEIARWQLSAGACGITCAKLSEVELMVASGIDDILLANQQVAPAKLRRLAKIQTQARVIAICDNPLAVKALSAAATSVDQTVPVLVDVDIGMHRTGAEPGAATLDLARQIDGAGGLELLGVMAYEGHVLTVEPPAAKEEACIQALDHLVAARDLIREHGMCADVVSAGGTGSYRITAAHEGITEIQAGGGIFMDAMYRHSMHVGEELKCALTCLTTVTSRRPGRVVLDAGFKTLSAFHHPPLPLGRDDVVLDYLSAEHGVFSVPEGRDGPALGERVELLVGYGDSTTFLHDHMLGLRKGRVERVLAIVGRGLLT
ncbi:DSD1 family PLP-dependent enzyme [Candidatus Latescibacterota bacterium]